MKTRQLKVAYLKALADGNTHLAAGLIQQIKKQQSAVPSMNEVLPDFPPDQSVKLMFWMFNPVTGLFHCGNRSEGVTRKELDEIISNDWKQAFDPDTKLRTLHEVLNTFY